MGCVSPVSPYLNAFAFIIAFYYDGVVFFFTLLFSVYANFGITNGVLTLSLFFLTFIDYTFIIINSINHNTKLIINCIWLWFIELNWCFGCIVTLFYIQLLIFVFKLFIASDCLLIVCSFNAFIKCSLKITNEWTNKRTKEQSILEFDTFTTVYCQYVHCECIWWDYFSFHSWSS